MDAAVTAEVILSQPAKIDGKIVMPDGKAISVTQTVREQLVAVGAVAGDPAVTLAGDAPIQLTAAQAFELAESVTAQAKLLANEMVEAAVAEAVTEAEAATQVKLDAAEQEKKVLSTTLYEAENEVAALRSKVTSLEAQIEAKPANTQAAKTTPRKGAAAKG